VIQNSLLLVSPLLYVDIYREFGYLHLDLAGFFLLAAGYILYSTQDTKAKRFYFIGGLCILGWVSCRILVQFILPIDFLNIYVTNFPAFIENLFFGGISVISEPPTIIDSPSIIMSFIFLIGGIVLAISTIFIWLGSIVSRNENEKPGITSRIFLIFGISNMIAILLLVLRHIICSNCPQALLFFQVAISLKGIVILLGIVAFIAIILNTRNREFKDKVLI